MAELSLTTSELNRLNEITNGGTNNFPAGYRYLSSVIASRPNPSTFSPQSYWLEKAIEINSNDPNSKANVFIRAVTRAGLLWDGKPGDPADVQKTSDRIAESVMRDTLKSGKLGSIDSIIKNDALLSTTAGGQTIGGWGGSFNYSRIQLTNNPSDTVGSRIRNDPKEYEKFVSVTAYATVEVMKKFGPINTETLLTALDTDLPAKEFADISNRVYDVVVDAYPMAGNPNVIDGYIARFNDSDAVVGWYSKKTDQTFVDVKDAGLTRDLNAKRAVRLAKNADQSWEMSPSSSTQVTFPGGTVVTRQYSGNKLLTCSVQQPNGLNLRVDFNAATGFRSLCAVKDGDNRLRQKLTYDDGGRPVSRVTYDALGTETWVNRTITYDKSGKVTARRIAYDDGKILRTTFDPQDDQIWGSKTVTYNASGQRIREVLVYDDGSKTGTTYNGPDQRVVGTISFDKNGNVTQDRGANDRGAFGFNGDGDGNGMTGMSTGRVRGMTISVSAGGVTSSGTYRWNDDGTLSDGTASNAKSRSLKASSVTFQDNFLTTDSSTVRQVGLANQSLELREPPEIDLASIDGPVFGWDGDSVMNVTAWAGPQDGWLAIDLSATGAAGADATISEAKELSFASWASPEQTGGDQVSDMEGLRLVFDTNHNDLLDTGDERWSEFRIWQDANQNGISDAGELRTLEQADIRLIELVPSSDGQRQFADGSKILGTNSFVRTDGSYGLAGDVMPAYRNGNLKS